jgi:hypothetical protein
MGIIENPFESADKPEKKPRVKKATTKATTKAAPKPKKVSFKPMVTGPNAAAKVTIHSGMLLRSIFNIGMTYNVGWYTIQNFNGNLILDMEDLYSEAKARDLFDLDFDNNPELKEFMGWLSKQGEGIDAKLEAQIQAGLVSFVGVKFFLKEGDQAVFKDANGQLQGIKIQSIKDNHSFFGVSKDITGLVLTHDGKAFCMGQVRHSIRAFTGTVPLKDLGIRPMTPEDEKYLRERGERYISMMEAPAYVSSKGNLRRAGWFGDQIYNATGRVMVDIKGMKSADPEYDKFRGVNRYDDDREELTREDITDEALPLAVPYVYGFSFRSKKWGEMVVDDLFDISYRNDAYNKLVLPSKTKELLLSLVDSMVISGGKDFIDGKGGGLVFLLHGSPGVGKTFTAEAISERLERPLYMISVGELGTHAQEVETKLTEVLETAQKWNAVLLLDECDIFLEKRQEDDMERNAVVSVFLRCVEYYQGILFLTTNRVKDLDPAFFSRISLPIHYDALDLTGRRSIWESHLKGHGVREDLAEQLADQIYTKALNGRQIKNCARLSTALAAKEGREVSYEDILSVVSYLSDFSKQTESTDAEICKSK